VAVASVTGYTPLQIAEFYNFPTTVTGQGQTIGIIELGGGFHDAELHTYFGNLGIEPPTVSVADLPNGGTNNSGTDPLDPANPDIEVLLDIEVAGRSLAGRRSSSTSRRMPRTPVFWISFLTCDLTMRG
jgi:kumamolisin